MSNVLIVEDDLLIADLLQDALEADGYLVIGVARTVSQALKLVKQHQPDIAVVDVRLENGELGTEFGSYVRKSGHCPILFSTGSSDDPVLTKSEGDAVMIKPYLLRDVGRALNILRELAGSGQTALPFPRNFRLLAPAEA